MPWLIYFTNFLAGVKSVQKIIEGLANFVEKQESKKRFKEAKKGMGKIKVEGRVEDNLQRATLRWYRVVNGRDGGIRLQEDIVERGEDSLDMFHSRILLRAKTIKEMLEKEITERKEFQARVKGSLQALH